jgi:hypothetical protein
MNWLTSLKPTRQNFSFVLTMTAMVGMFALAWFKNVDITSSLPVILATYLGARATEKSVMVMSAAKDTTANTRDIIGDLEHIERRKPDSPD